MVEDKGTSDDNVLQSLSVTQGHAQLSFEYQGQTLLNCSLQIVPMFDHDYNKKASFFFFFYLFKSEFFVFHLMPLVH